MAEFVAGLNREAAVICAHQLDGLGRLTLDVELRALARVQSCFAASTSGGSASLQLASGGAAEVAFAGLAFDGVHLNLGRCLGFWFGLVWVGSVRFNSG